jgi:hypothetical protein
MKRLLIALAISCVAAGAFAQVGADRDVLVTPDGIVYTLEQQTPSDSSGVAATNVLQLSVQTGVETQRVLVPESLTAGFHSDGALAYDSSSKTLFLMWTHMPNGMSSELLLASYRDGKWQRAISIDSHGYDNHLNLRLGITRRVSQLQKDGTYADAPALILHALWWDSSAHGEEAKYAMLPVENGAVAEGSIEIHSLEEFVSDTEEFNAVDPKFNAEILRHPGIVSSPMQSSVDIVFGDAQKNSIHKITLRPTAEHRIHIPVGIGGGGPGTVKPLNIAAPASFTADWQGRVTVIERGDRLVFANATDKALSYITYSDGAWTDTKSIALSSKLPAEAALAAVDKMVSSQ